MGWKNVREHYGIDHIVKMVDGSMHIGSGYVGDLVTVTPEGHAEVHRTFADSPELQQYTDGINADPSLFRDLMARPDVFAASIPAYTWKGGEIIEKACEEFGWPNVTHDGEIMYENRFFPDREEALENALRDARATVETYEEIVLEKREDLARREAMLEAAMGREAAFKALAMAAAQPLP